MNRRNTLISTTLIILSVTSPCNNANADSQNTAINQLIIANVTLISAERKQPLEHAFVRIQNNRIIEVSASEIKSENVRVIDGSGQYLIPGLMDSHVHLALMPGIGFGDSGPLPELLPLQHAYDMQQPRSYLYHGFTQVLDPASSPQTMELFNRQPLKPDLFFCGATPILGGYPTIFFQNDQIAMKYFPYFVDQKVAGKAPPKGVDMSLHTPEASTERMKKDGAICNKIHIEDGFGKNSSWPMLSTNNIKRLREAAHNNGLKIMAHANAYDMQTIAEAMDVDIIAHGLWNWIEFDGEKVLPDEIKRLLDRIIAKKIAFQATSGVMIGLRDVTAGIDINTPAYSNVTPAALLEYYATEPARWFQREMLQEFGELSKERIYKIQNALSEQGDMALKYLAEHGGFLLLASDTPASPSYVSQPGLNSFLEMRHMAKVGVSLRAIFESATINNAKAFNLDHNYGTIEPGKIANLLLLSANPLKTVNAYDQITQIILGGKVIQRDSLKAR